MKAVILVGGEGTRLRPLTCTIPKAMVPVVNRPFLEHMIDHLKGHMIDDIILALGYMPHQIQSYFGDGSSFGIKLTYVVEGSPRGTAGAVKNVEQHLDDTFLVFNGDIFSGIDLREMIRLHQERHAKATIALTPVENPTRYGVVEVNPEGRVQRFIEKPSREEAPCNTINAGAYVIEPDVLRHIPSDSNFSFELGLFPHLLVIGYPIYGYPSDAYWIDIGTPEKYKELNHDLLQGKADGRNPGAQADDGVVVDEGCAIHPEARLEGPTVIGRSCVIGPRAQLRGPSVIGQGCHIGEGSIIEQAIVWNDARLGQMVSLQDCVVAERVSIGDRSHIAAGCILGNSVVIGCDETLVAGTTVWPQQVPNEGESR